MYINAKALTAVEVIIHNFNSCDNDLVEVSLHMRKSPDIKIMNNHFHGYILSFI